MSTGRPSAFPQSQGTMRSADHVDRVQSPGRTNAAHVTELGTKLSLCSLVSSTSKGFSLKTATCCSRPIDLSNGRCSHSCNRSHAPVGPFPCSPSPDSSSTNHALVSSIPLYQTPGMIAHFLLIFSSPNFSTYHLRPLTALGNMVRISLMRNVRAGAQPQPAAIQNPNHSTHSQK